MMAFFRKAIAIAFLTTALAGPSQGEDFPLAAAFNEMGFDLLGAE